MRKFLIIFVLLVSSLAMVSSVEAKPRKPKPEAQHSQIDFLVQETRQEEDPMMEAIKIATLSAHKRSHRHCWRAVKDALVEANVVPYRPTSRYAWQSGEELKEKFSFFKLDIVNPFDAPVGAILVYGGGPGHVEIRTPDGFVSDFANPRPSRRPLIGVYVSSASNYADSPKIIRQ